IILVGFALLFACPAFAGEHAALARVTVYWPDKSSGANAAWDGKRLREGHCAVDSKKIPYGSKIGFQGGEWVGVAHGPNGMNTKASRASGRSAAERNAIVIDRFCETKKKALAWAEANPLFMVVQVRTPDAEEPGLEPRDWL